MNINISILKTHINFFKTQRVNIYLFNHYRFDGQMETRAITDMDIKAVTMWKYGKIN